MPSILLLCPSPHVALHPQACPLWATRCHLSRPHMLAQLHPQAGRKAVSPHMCLHSRKALLFRKASWAAPSTLPLTSQWLNIIVVKHKHNKPPSNLVALSKFFSWVCSLHWAQLFLLHVISAGAANSKRTSSPTNLLPELQWPDCLPSIRLSANGLSRWPAWVSSPYGHLGIVRLLTWWLSFTRIWKWKLQGLWKWSHTVSLMLSVDQSKQWGHLSSESWRINSISWWKAWLSLITKDT